MTLLKASLSCVLCFFFVFAFSQPGEQNEIKLSESAAVYGFYEYLPENYDDGNDKYPLLVYLHGRGETGNGDEDLWKVKSNGPHRLIEEGREFPAVVLSPQSPDDWDVDSLDMFVEWAFENYRVDTARLYMTGISMGGAGTWLYSVSYPEKVRAIIPIAGDAHAKNAENLATTPVWAFHNQGDLIVEVELTQEWIAEIEKAGGQPHVTIYEDSVHDAWTRTYNNDSTWAWLFAQKPEVEPEEPLGHLEDNPDFAIFPNPFSEKLTLNTSIPVTSATLFSLDGRVLQQWDDLNGNKELYPFSGIRPGVYLLEVRSAHQRYHIKVVKK